MKLTMYQISKIKYRISLSDNKEIVMINVSADKNMDPEESSTNIYCINQNNEIIWQVKEIKTKRPFNDDMFVYLAKDDVGEIIADRYSGFEYKINPETGEAIRFGFHK